MKPLLLTLILCAGFAHASLAQVVGPEPLYKSRLLKSGDEERLIPIEVALKKRDLYLIVSSDGNASHDWASWIEPEIIMKDGTTVDHCPVRLARDDGPKLLRSRRSPKQKKPSSN